MKDIIQYLQTIDECENTPEEPITDEEAASMAALVFLCPTKLFAVWIYSVWLKIKIKFR